MNFIFISPQFPHTYWQFCDRLRRNGANVLGIGDSPYDALEEHLKQALTEYYRVDSLEEAVQMARKLAAAGDVVSLSPACASFDRYPNFEVRGKHFKELVNAL